MHDLKYLIGNYTPTGATRSFELALIFPALIPHHEAALVFGGTANVISAGFLMRKPVSGQYLAHGTSVSLGVGSRPQDSEFINRQLFGTTRG